MAMLKKRKAPMINMDRNEIDSNYRYKFEKVSIRKEGKNTGQKTVICNILPITRDVIGTKMCDNDSNSKDDITNRTAKHIARFIGQKVSSRCQFNKARAAIIISGVQSQATLQGIMFDYVEEFTFCPACNRPELSPAILPTISCPACGYQRKNGKNGKKVKKEKNRQKKDKSKRKKSKRKPKLLNENDSVEEDEWKVENSKNEIQQKIANDPIFSFYHFLRQREDVSIDEINEKIKLLRLAHSLGRDEEIRMVITVLMEFEKGHEALNASIKKYKQIFEVYSIQNDDAKTFLETMEKMIVQRDELLKHSYSIFFCLYDEEVIDEDELLEWFKSSNIDDDGKMIRSNVQSFVDWLEENEEED